jgi:hypothetical protein
MKLFIQILLVNFALSMNGQNIELENPSFEGEPKAGMGTENPVNWWDDCGFSKETSPDIQPGAGFNVTQTAFDGDTYLAMVTRDNDTWEALGQELKTPMKADKCYYFSTYLAMSDRYDSRSKSTLKEVSFSNSVVLRIWAGHFKCEKLQLLAESPPVASSEWEIFECTFTPSDNYTFFYIEAYYVDDEKRAYNGHILVDNLSDLVEVKCKGD